MSTQPANVLVPPHLRKRAAAPVSTKSDVRLGDLVHVGISDTSPAAVKSQLGKLAQVQASPSVAVLVLPLLADTM